MSGYRSHFRRSADDLLRDEDGQPRLSEPYLKQLCKEMKQYTTPRLNDQLYLHFKGFPKIECLDEYTGLRCLWLEGNGLRKIEGLDANTELRGIYCQQNCIETIENIGHLAELDAINCSNNMIKTVTGLADNKKLNTLTISHNKLKNSASVRGVLECPSLKILDFSHNDIDDPTVIEVFAAMENLRVLNLMGNKCVKMIPQYRKTFIVRCPQLTYLDDRPVFPKERAQADAFFNGWEGIPAGREAERAARLAFVAAEKEKQNQGIRHLMEIQARARAAAVAGVEGGDPDRSDSEGSGDEGDSVDKSLDNSGGYDEWQQGEKFQPSMFDQRSGKIPAETPWVPAPMPEGGGAEPIEVITGPKAADIDLFDSEDEIDTMEEEDSGPAMVEISTTRTGDAEASGADDQVPALERVDIATGEVVETLSDPAVAQKPRKMLIEEVSSDSEDEIPEEIIGKPRSKSKWHSVEESGPATAPPMKKPLIEMIGGDDMDGLD